MEPHRSSVEEAPFTDVSDAQLAAIVERHGLDVPINAVARIPPTGVVNTIHALGDHFVLRVPKNESTAVAETYTEATAAPLAYATGIRTPALVVLDDARDIVEVPYTIFERAPGSALFELGGHPSGLAELWVELGRDLAVLHHAVSDCPDPYDHLNRPRRAIDPEPMLEAVLAARLLNRDNIATVRGWLDQLHEAAADGDGYRRFVHDDVKPTHVMAEYGRYTALIDWGGAGWGDPALDFRLLPARAVPDVLAGYRQVHPLDGDESAEARIWWDQIMGALHGLRRPPTNLQLGWNRPPAARLLELLAYLAEGGQLGSFAQR